MSIFDCMRLNTCLLNKREEFKEFKFFHAANRASNGDVSHNGANLGPFYFF